MIYVHVLDWLGGTVKLPNIPAKIIAAEVLGGGRADVHQAEDGVEISVAAATRDANDTVIVLTADSDALRIPVVAVLAPRAQ